MFCLMLGGGLSGPAFVVAIVLLLYFLCLDIGHNKRFFRHNIIHSLLVALNSYREMTSFEQRSMRRLLSSLAVILGVGGVSVSYTHLEVYKRQPLRPRSGSVL